MDGIIDKKHSQGRFERIQLKLNHYGLVQALIKSGLIPDGFTIEYACFDEDSPTLLELTMRKEIAETLGQS